MRITDWAFSVMLKSTYSYWNLYNNYNYLAGQKGMTLIDNIDLNDVKDARFFLKMVYTLS